MPQVDEWIAAVVESPSVASEDGETFRPAVLVWFEPETGAVVDLQLTRPGLADAPALFRRVTEQPKEGPPRTPRRVRVADPVLAAALRGNIGDAEVVVGDISEAREALASLAEYMSRMEVEPDIEPEAWARMFRAAAALYRASPWNVVPPDEWIGVECERLGISAGALTVVGQHGQSHGFLLCRSVDDARAWLAAGERRARGEEAAFPAEFYMFGYDHRRELPPEDVEEVARHGWEVASPEAYPSLTVLDQETEGRLPTDDELAGLTAVIEALAAFVVDEPWSFDPVEWQGEIGGTRVRLIAPLDLPRASTDPADVSLDILGGDGEVDPELMGRYRTALMTRLASRAEISDEVLSAAEMLVEFAAQFHRVTFGMITLEELTALLLETIPAQLAVEADEAGRIVDAARALMQLAGDQLGSEAAPAAVAMLGLAFEQRLADELANPLNFSPGKQLVMAGIAAGFDMSTEEGVGEFVEAFAREQRKPKKSPKKTPAKKKAAPKRKPAKKKPAPEKSPKKPATRRAKRR